MQNIDGKTVLVTGGTGFIGRALVVQLVARGAHVFVLTRGTKKPTDKVTYVQSLAELGATDIDIIINLAGEPIAQRWTAAAKRRIEDSRIATTTALVDFIARAPRKPQLFISASAIGYYGTSDDAILNEESVVQSPALYSAQLCAKWEAAAIPAAQYNVRTVILRLGVVLEQDGGILKKMLLPFKFGLGGRIGHGRQWLSWIDRDDVVKLIFFAIADDTLQGSVNATAPHPVTNNDFTKAMGHALKRPVMFPVPTQVLRVAYGEMAEELMLQGQKVIPAKLLNHGFVFDYPVIEQSLAKIFKSGRK